MMHATEVVAPQFAFSTMQTSAIKQVTGGHAFLNADALHASQHGTNVICCATAFQISLIDGKN